MRLVVSVLLSVARQVSLRPPQLGLHGQHGPAVETSRSKFVVSHANLADVRVAFETLVSLATPRWNETESSQVILRNQVFLMSLRPHRTRELLGDLSCEQVLCYLLDSGGLRFASEVVVTD